MNEIRKLPEFGGDQVDCIDTEDIKLVLRDIIVSTKTINTFFDVDNYDDNNKPDFSFETFYTQTSLNPYHGQLK